MATWAHIPPKGVCGLPAAGAATTASTTMGCATLLTVLALASAAPPPDARPAVAIAAMRGAAEINPDVVRVLEDRVAEVVRRSNAFSRVVGTRDMEAVLGLEQTRQLVSCVAESCLVEMAGALGVELLLTGQLARVGKTLSLNLKLLNARNATLAGAVSATFDEGEAAALAGTELLSNKLLKDAGLLQPPANDATARAPQGGVLPKVIMGVGGVAAVAGGLALLAGVAAAVGGALVLVVPLLTYVPTPGLSGDLRVMLLPGGSALLAAVGGAGFLLGVLLVAAGVTSGVAGWVLN